MLWTKIEFLGNIMCLPTNLEIQILGNLFVSGLCHSREARTQKISDKLFRSCQLCEGLLLSTHEKKVGSKRYLGRASGKRRPFILSSLSMKLWRQPWAPQLQTPCSLLVWLPMVAPHSSLLVLQGRRSATPHEQRVQVTFLKRGI